MKKTMLSSTLKNALQCINSRSLFKASALGSLACLSLEGCSPMASRYVSAAQLSSGTAAQATADYSCIDNFVDYELRTNVIAYELTGGGGLQAGFSPTGFLSNIGVGVSYDSGELDMHMQLVQPMYSNAIIADQLGSGNQSKVTFDASLGLGIVNLSPSVYMTTPVAKVSQTALSNTWGAIETQLATKSQTQWWTHISQMSSAYGFFVPVGNNAGLQVGDELKVMDAAYHWTGNTPCVGDFESVTLNSQTPLALAKVVSVTPNTAFLQVEAATLTGTLSTYNYVTISSLAQPAAPVATPCNNFLGIGCPSTSTTTVPARTTLGRSLRIGSTTSPVLTFQNNNTLDITPYLTSQLSTMLNDTSGAGAGFYIHN